MFSRHLEPDADWVEEMNVNNDRLGLPWPCRPSRTIQTVAVEGCDISGSISVNRVPGVLVFTARSDDTSFSAQAIDVSHVPHARRAVEPIPAGYEDAHYQERNVTVQQFLNVVGFGNQDNSWKTQLQQRSYQFSATTTQYEDKTPYALFTFDISPLVKQIRDRLNFLKTWFKTNEQRSKGASGVEESLHAVNIQSHYADVDGLVWDYIDLEQLHQDKKIAKKKLSKKKKEADLAQCAKDIVAESNRRRADREAELSDSDVSDGGSCVSATDSLTSRGSRAPKRTIAFLAEVKRQEKRYKEQMDMKVRELEQKQKQFDDGLAFEREQAQAKLQFDMEVQANNRNVILECAKIFGAALVNKD
ncbi:hypothetical protein L917_15006 [Phytophthora nicotianae]|uniref:Endoplasmic reticulum vesicle transporter C-terminal domain-containing protein n=1 Tax=Phytophthora nicotianae TaxID=4792 RepID=W2KK67_PHYNI|nr:hypothetical protein L917_15006 [Phytophthora nicotianae]